MNFRQLVRVIASIAAVAIAALVTGCDGADVSINGEKGKPLAELDLAGTPPGELVLLAPDEVRIRDGAALAITVDGGNDVVDAMRFTLKDGTLGILRKDGHRTDGGGTDGGRAIINVTMPAPRKLVTAGSGTIVSESLARAAEITIAGSGDVETMNVAADTLQVTIAGSGNYRAAGAAGKLDMTITGSGNAAMEALRADKAHVSITGSGRSSFASDGDVAAEITGSGAVNVNGRAQCGVKATGSGKLACKPAGQPPAP